MVVIRRDSDADGVTEATDATVPGATVIVEVRAGNDSLMSSFTGLTDRKGVFKSGWLSDLSAGTYRAEVIQLVRTGMTWKDSLDPTSNDGDMDSDGLPDDGFAIP